MNQRLIYQRHRSLQTAAAIRHTRHNTTGSHCALIGKRQAIVGNSACSHIQLIQQHIFIQGGLNIFVTGSVNARRSAHHAIYLTDPRSATLVAKHGHLVKQNGLLICRASGLRLVLSGSVVIGGSHDLVPLCSIERASRLTQISVIAYYKGVWQNYRQPEVIVAKKVGCIESEKSFDFDSDSSELGHRATP